MFYTLQQWPIFYHPAKAQLKSKEDRSSPFVANGSNLHLYAKVALEYEYKVDA